MLCVSKGSRKRCGELGANAASDRRDRERATRDQPYLERWERAARARAADRRVPVFELTDPGRDAAAVESLTEEERALREDFEWIAGYRRGRDDSVRGDSKQPLEGPGAPPGSWDPSEARRAGYNAGLGSA